MSFCPQCSYKNITSALTVIGSDKKLRICNNEECIYVERFSPVLNFDPEKTKVETSLSDSDSVFSLSSSDSEDNVITSSNTNIDFNDYLLSNVKRHFIKIMDAVESVDGIFNWFGLPLMMKFNSQICFFLIIHLNLFHSNLHSNMKTLRDLYYRNEFIFNCTPGKLHSLLGFKFALHLFNEHKIFNLSKIGILNMSERILRSMNNLISTFKNGSTYKTVYEHKQKCRQCDRKIAYLKEDISIRLMEDYRLNANQFIYLSDCRQCSGKCDVTVTIERLSNFVIIDLPNGTNTIFKNLLSTPISDRTDKKIELQAIIEFESRCPVDDVPEKVPNITEFIFKKPVRQPVKYRIHFRNSVGWYCVDHRSKSVVKSIPQSSVDISPADVRLLVYGHRESVLEQKAAVGLCTLYKELREYKKPPPGYLQYPRDQIKYWLLLFKYRDFHVRRGPMSRADTAEIALSITLKLNDRLKERKHRLMAKTESEAPPRLEAQDGDMSSIDFDETTFNGMRESILEEVDFKAISAAGIDKGRSLSMADQSSPPPTSVIPLPPIHRYEQARPPRDIDDLIQSKKRKMSAKNRR